MLYFNLDIINHITYSALMNPIKGLKAVLFDIDDTLFDRRTAVKNALRFMMERLPELFTDIPQERVFLAFKDADEQARLAFENGAAGEGIRDNRSREFLRALDLPEHFSEQVTEHYVAAFPAASAEVKDARRIVEMLSRIYKLGVISNAFPDVQYKKLEGIGILEYFQIIILSEELGVRKPDEKIFQEAAAALNCSLKECLYVGNSFQTDIVGAMRAGMKACWFNAEGIRMHPGDSKPDFVITRLSELLQILGVGY
jgi:HAD superfamily hydrolase (TIGR01549 family)